MEETMDRIKKAALITRLIKQLRKRGSWCGETHVQKAIFFLQEAFHVPLGFKFILYKHGPFSFDLRDELSSLRADELIRFDPQWPYGPRISPTDRAKYVESLRKQTVQRYTRPIDFVAKKLGPKSVTELERIATAFFISKHVDSAFSVDERAKRLTELKPHISFDEAKSAVEEVEHLLAKVPRVARGSSLHTGDAR